MLVVKCVGPPFKLTLSAVHTTVSKPCTLACRTHHNPVWPPHLHLVTSADAAADASGPVGQGVHTTTLLPGCFSHCATEGSTWSSIVTQVLTRFTYHATCMRSGVDGKPPLPTPRCRMSRWASGECVGVGLWQHLQYSCKPACSTPSPRVSLPAAFAAWVEALGCDRFG